MGSPNKVNGLGPSCRSDKGMTACQKRRNTGCWVVSMDSSSRSNVAATGPQGLNVREQ